MGTRAFVWQSFGGPGLVVNHHSDFSTPHPPIQVEAAINAPAARIFNAWTIPEYVETWYPNQSGATVRCDIDLRSGGHYRFAVMSDSGPEIVWGVFRRVLAPHKLIYSFRSSLTRCNTLVDLLLSASGDATHLRLRQDGFRSAEEGIYFSSEWTSRIERLSLLLS